MFPMSKFSVLASRIRRRFHRRHVDRLVIESCPLHTERSEWAAHAPAQVTAACQRGADVIAFTEVHTPLASILAQVAARNGYGFFHNPKSDSALAFKMTLDNAKASLVQPGGGVRPFVKVEFTFHGSDVTVFGLHWPTNHSSNLAARRVLTNGIITQMDAASQGKRLAFFLADSNPDRVLSDPTSEPRATLKKAGLILVNEELDEWPHGLGVTTVGSNVRDGRVKALSAVLHAALGSDHRPETATFGIRRIH